MQAQLLEVSSHSQTDIEPSPVATEHIVSVVAL